MTTSVSGSGLLHEAARHGRKGEIEVLLAEGTDVNAKDWFHMDPSLENQN